MNFVSYFSLFAFALTISAQTPPTARQVIDRIQAEIKVALPSNTVDTFKAGNPDAPVTCVAVTMMATYDVLERAAAEGCNLVITHEPTFYNHLDSTKTLESQSDAVLKQKRDFIEKNKLIVWRFHDGWHSRTPDGILTGMERTLAWLGYQDKADNHLLTIPGTTLNELAAAAKTKLHIRIVRVVGDPNLKISRIALLPGAEGSASQIHYLEQNGVEALIIGETPEWETVEYVADAASQGKKKALIILGHIPSEQAGMEECAGWLRTLMPQLKVNFIPAKEPFFSPK